MCLPKCVLQLSADICVFCQGWWWCPPCSSWRPSPCSRSQSDWVPADRRRDLCDGRRRTQVSEVKYNTKCSKVLCFCVNKVKEKVALEQVTKAQRGSRGIALLFLDLGARWGWVVNAKPRPIYPWERRGAICIGAGWAPGSVWTGAENVASTWIRSPDRPVRSESLCRLSYPARVLVSRSTGSFTTCGALAMLLRLSHRISGT
jgi:hypothetical protein